MERELGIGERTREAALKAVDTPHAFHTLLCLRNMAESCSRLQVEVSSKVKTVIAVIE